MWKHWLCFFVHSVPPDWKLRLMFDNIQTQNSVEIQHNKPFNLYNLSRLKTFTLNSSEVQENLNIIYHSVYINLATPPWNSKSNMVDNAVVFDGISKAGALTSCFILAISYILVFYIKKSPYHRYVSKNGYRKLEKSSDSLNSALSISALGDRGWGANPGFLGTQPLLAQATW